MTSTPPPPPCDIPSGRCFFTGPWTVTRSSLRMLRRVAAFCRPLRPVLLLVSFPRSRSLVVGVPGLCWWRDVPFAGQWRPVVGVLGVVLVVAGVVSLFDPTPTGTVAVTGHYALPGGDDNTLTTISAKAELSGTRSVSHMSDSKPILRVF